MCLRLLARTVLLLSAAHSLGCAQHATFRQQRPALVNAPIRRLAVVELASQRAEGDRALAALWAELQQSGRFDLVRHEQLQRAVSAPLLTANGSLDHDAAIHAGRRLGVDGLLITQVRFLETDGTVYGTKSLRIGDPEVVAAVRYELIDVRTGQVLDRNVAKSEPFKGDLNPHTPGPSAESEVLSRLASEGGVQVAYVLIPHEQEIKVQLAHSSLGPGSSDVRKGMGAAQAGNWAEARQHWLAAVEADPKNDAAAYNLALAHEALGEFALARRALEAAIAARPSSRYREAVQRVDRAEAELRLAQVPGPPQLAQRPAPQNGEFRRLPPQDAEFHPPQSPGAGEPGAGEPGRGGQAPLPPAATGRTFWR